MNEDLKDYFWNPEEWHPDDKLWMAERKKEWAYVQHNLKNIASTEIRGAYMKQHKELFFKGTIDPTFFNLNGGTTFAYSLPLFVLWYHPNLTDKATKRITDQTCKTPANAYAMAKCRYIIDKVSQSNGKFKPEYGFFGDKSQTIMQLFWGEPLVGSYFDQLKFATNPKFETPKMLLNTYMVSSFFWQGVWSQSINNTHHPGQYLFKHAMSVADKLDDFYKRKIKNCASAILFYDDLTDTTEDTPESEKFRLLMLKRYENGEFHPIVQDIWDEMKASNKLSIIK